MATKKMQNGGAVQLWKMKSGQINEKKKKKINGVTSLAAEVPVLVVSAA